jgi:hypothetical protein
MCPIMVESLGYQSLAGFHIYAQSCELPYIVSTSILGCPYVSWPNPDSSKFISRPVFDQIKDLSDQIIFLLKGSTQK